MLFRSIQYSESFDSPYTILISAVGSLPLRAKSIPRICFINKSCINNSTVPGVCFKYESVAIIKQYRTAFDKAVMRSVAKLDNIMPACNAVLVRLINVWVDYIAVIRRIQLQALKVCIVIPCTNYFWVIINIGITIIVNATGCAFLNVGIYLPVAVAAASYTFTGTPVSFYVCLEVMG